jgi:NAD(P)H-flavin reductase
MEKIQVSHDTFKFVFRLPEPDQVMGLPVGGHIFFHATIGDDVKSRKYTPVSLINERGKIEFVIKVY